MDNFNDFLKGHKCGVCGKPLRTNKKHIEYYKKGWIPKYHKTKCNAIAKLLGY